MTRCDRGRLAKTPLALEFAADARSVAIYDRTAENDVIVGGERFDIIVSDAFSRHELTCGDCDSTEAMFLVLRSAP